MGSAELRKHLRMGAGRGRDTRRIHDLGRAYGRERAHLALRPRRGVGAEDFLWDAAGASYKVVTRTVDAAGSAATFEVSASAPADYLLLVLVDRRSLQLVEMARVVWSMVEWLGRPHGNRWRLRWGDDAPLRGVAEVL